MGKVFTLYINLHDKHLDFDILKGKKFIIAISPSSINNLTEKDIRYIKGFLESGCVLGQRGDSGRCKYLHKDGTDPWHENFCLHNPSIDFDEQYDFMLNGKQVLEEFFDEVEIYCPINHLFDENTIKAAQILKYKYMVDLNLDSIKPYRINELVILPESKEKGDIIYAHYSDLENKEIKEFIEKTDFIIPGEIELSENDNKLLIINEIKKKMRKLERDLKNLEG